MTHLCIQPMPGIGDLIWHLPHLRAIAAMAGAPITLLAKPSSKAADVLAAEPWVKEILWLDRAERRRKGLKGFLRTEGRHDGFRGAWRLARMLRAHHFESHWIFHHSPHYALISWLSGAPKRYGYCWGGHRYFLNHPTPLPMNLRRATYAERATAFLKAHGLDPMSFDTPLGILPSAHQSIHARFDHLVRLRVVFGIGGTDPKKLWSPEAWCALGKVFLERGYDILICGGPLEHMAARELAAALDAPAHVGVLTDGSVQESLALLTSARCIISNDNALLNLAGALHVPCYGLYGGRIKPLHTSWIRPIRPADATQLSGGGAGVHGIDVAQVLDAISEVI